MIITFAIFQTRQPSNDDYYQYTGTSGGFSMKRIDLSQLVDEPVSHNPEIKKRVLFSNGEIPNITQYAQARLELGQVASGHTHGHVGNVLVRRWKRDNEG
jgi:hypothetical protein